ncbi:hypothetical protein QAD02_014755 [Eretmocerus hayati]|uniref:Uncharacterized protein n=1 Tax=Eretmocerus hayati TaxID=131215 RepID=A0ACC2P667_9HYME|nr:hypothetical protein QAD02_014755 [Eretmocerus hayati]
MEMITNISRDATGCEAKDPEDEPDREDCSLKFDGEHVLQDMMDVVCEHLKVYDLCQVAQVCRSWNKEARREISKRVELKYGVLPHLFSYEMLSASFHISKTLDIMPYLTLLFPGTNHLISDVRDEDDVHLEQKTFEVYGKQLPHSLLVVGVSEAVLNRDLIHSCPTCSRSNAVSREYQPSGTLSLFLPLSERLKFKMSCMFESEFYEDNSLSHLSNMMNTLLPNCLSTKSALLIFVYSRTDCIGTSDMIAIQDSIKSRFRTDLSSLWGLTTQYKIFARQNGDEVQEDISRKIAKIVGISLTGLNFESWSAVINITESYKIELERKLKNLRNQITLRKYTVGLITAPVCTQDEYGSSDFDNQDLIYEVKELLPDIDFIGTYGDENNIYFGVHRLDNGSIGFMNKKIISIMILTHD